MRPLLPHVTENSGRCVLAATHSWVTKVSEVSLAILSQQAHQPWRICRLLALRLIRLSTLFLIVHTVVSDFLSRNGKVPAALTFTSDNINVFGVRNAALFKIGSLRMGLN